MDQQHDSLLFRIPRELRDEIYQYYVLEEDGYHHDSVTGKLRIANGDPIDLSLQYSCKRVAAEMDGLALEANTITFRTMLDTPGPGQKFSNALLWDHLLHERGRVLKRMLCWAYSSVTPEVIGSLRARHPESYAVKEIEKRLLKHGNI
jgi:hypothetical protein